MNMNIPAGRGVLIILACWGASSVAAELQRPSFQSLISDPSHYHRKLVSLVGVVIGNGPEFVFYKNRGDGRKPVAASKAIRLIAKDDSLHGLFDSYRVKVSGVVDAYQHGFYGYACTIWVSRIERLSEYPVVKPEFPMAVFLNDTNETILIHVDGDSVSTNTVATSHFAAEAFINEGARITVSSAQGTPLVRSKVSKLLPSSPYYDRKSQKFFYRVSERTIDRVPASVGKLWKQIGGG